MEKRKDCINPCIGPDCEGCRNYKPKEEVISMETRKKQIIEILKSPHYFINGKIYLSDFYRIADAILALPIEVPSEEEIKESSQYYIEKHTIDRPMQWTYIDGYEDAISEIIKRNQK